ncbi:MAG TPA: ComF family protein [Acidobacteriaceae bacterium]|nr:ComF family protein [Acidobacteriaceae bacterium]
MLRSCGGVAGGIATDLVNALWPSDCRLCGGPLIAVSRAMVCDACVERVKPQEKQGQVLCSRCGEAVGMESARYAEAMGTSECTMCRLAPPEFERAVAYAEFDAEVREMLHLLKFSGMREMAGHVLGRCLSEAMLKLEPETAREVMVIPVPLFAARQRSRGFNQAALLAKAAVKRVRKQRPGWTLRIDEGVLQRVKDTKASFALEPHQRRRNLRGAFRVVDPEAVRGREVLLIDDILTTGATARECARVLRRAGAEKVWVATVARAQPESVRMAEEEGVARWDAEEAVVRG